MGISPYTWLISYYLLDIDIGDLSRIDFVFKMVCGITINVIFQSYSEQENSIYSCTNACKCASTEVHPLVSSIVLYTNLKRALKLIVVYLTNSPV